MSHLSCCRCLMPLVSLHIPPVLSLWPAPLSSHRDVTGGGGALKSDEADATEQVLGKSSLSNLVPGRCLTNGRFVVTSYCPHTWRRGMSGMSCHSGERLGRIPPPVSIVTKISFHAITPIMRCGGTWDPWSWWSISSSIFPCHFLYFTLKVDQLLIRWLSPHAADGHWVNADGYNVIHIADKATLEM